MIETQTVSEAAEKLKPLLRDLPVADRIGLAQFIWDTVDEEEESASPEDIQAAWKVEILRRLEEVESGKAKTVPVEEAFRRFREKYGGRFSLRG